MAGDWLKFDKATPEKPEVFAIAAETGLDPDAVVGKLIRVWSWFDTHTESGNARSVTSALLDRIAGVTGFVIAMQNTGWATIENGGCSLPNFDRHCGKTAKTRALGAIRTNASRSRNDVSVTSALPEKRREENKKLSITNVIEVTGEPDDVGGENSPSKPKSNQCPIAGIIDLYHEYLPTHPRMEKRTSKRDGYIRARWAEDLPTMDAWRNYFTDVSSSRFMTGKIDPKPGYKRFIATLDWLTKADNFAKVSEGEYHR